VTATSSRALLVAAVLLGVLPGGCAPAPAVAPLGPPPPVDVAQSIVIVDADGADVDMTAPWGTGKAWTRTLTGVVVEGRAILVGGWGLYGQQHVHAQRQGTTVKSTARLVVFDADCGLALLTVDDPAFWSGLQPAAFASAALRPGPARVLHAAADGARVDATAAAVGDRRLSGRCSFPEVKIGQVDAKHVAQSDVIGSATQVLGVVAGTTNDEVLAFGPSTLANFVAEAKRPTYRGVPALGTPWQSLTNPVLRQELGLGPNDGGVRIVSIHQPGSGAGALQVGDILLAVDGRKIAADGSSDDPVLGRLPFHAAVADRNHPGDVLKLDIVRGGVRQSVSVTLKGWPGSSDLVPWYRASGKAGVYAVEGGLVFENLSGEYLQTFGKDWETRAPSRLLDSYWNDKFDPLPDRSRVVVLTRVLADPATLGYEHVHDLIVERINGLRLQSLDDVHLAFAHPSGGFHEVTFAPGQHVSRIVIDVHEASTANDRLRATYGPSRP